MEKLNNYKDPRAVFILALQATTMFFATASPFLTGQRWIFHWPQNLLDIVASFLSVIGLVICISAARALGQSLTGSPIPKDDGALIIKWPFSVVRNPIYVGGVFMYLSWGIWFRSPGTIVWTLLFFIVIWKKVLFEEKVLLEKFGTSYQNYCGKVGRFIPKLRN